MHDVALVRMEAHVPGVFPALEGLQVFMESELILDLGNEAVQDGVVRELTGEGGDPVWEVVDVYEEQTGSKHAALGDV
jgi:hypothetical protein